ncbi:MAG: helix-turn-helix domain-containing protein [Candidatus Aenigmarchaeota archaeon]|nr:helix-turn-helix domain-containing protein [Candidatus Aenigmarchaeota archaeon]
MPNDIRIIELKKLIRRLKKIRGRHTELVTVYVPAGYSLIDIINQLKSEGSTTQNIKSKATRNNVLAALDKIIQHLRIYRETPENGLAIFSGNVSETEGAQKLDLWAIEPPEKMQNKLYWCDQQFVLEPLEEMVKDKEVYGLLAVDKSEATIGYLAGKKIVVFKHVDSLVPSKTAAGGWCVHENTMVQVPDGRLVSIKDLKGGRVSAFNFIEDKTESTSFDTIRRREAKTAYEIVTQAPSMKIVATPEHNFFVFDRNTIMSRPLSEIKEGDLLLSPLKMDLEGRRMSIDYETPKSLRIKATGIKLLVRKRISNGMSQKYVAKKLGLSQTIISKLELNQRMLKKENLNKLLSLLGIDRGYFYRHHIESSDLVKIPKLINEEFCQFLGYFMGGGGIDEFGPRLYEGDIQLAEFYSSLSRRLFGANTRIRKRVSKGYYEIKIHSKYLSGFINTVFPSVALNAHSRSIPEQIQMSQNPEVAAFIKGLFDAEGYIDTNAGVVGITMSSEAVIRTLQQLLLRFGIVSSFSVRSPKGSFSKVNKYCVRITGPVYIVKFEQMIGFSSKGKTNRIKDLIRHKKIGYLRHEVLGNLIALKIKGKKAVESPGIFYDISVPKLNNFIANGLILHNSQQRYARIREGLLNDFLKEVSDIATQAFLGKKELIGIIIGGPGPVKDDFVKDGYLHYELQKKVAGVVDISYTNEAGLHELVNRAQKILSNAAVTKEIELLKGFFTELQKDSGLAIYGWGKVKEALQNGMLQKLIVSEDFDWIRSGLKCGSCGNQETRDYKPNEKQLCSNCRMEMRTVNTEDLIDVAITTAEDFKTEYHIVSSSTREGAQLKELGGIGGILRYRVKY